MKTNRLPIVIFNGTIATTNGLYRISDIDIKSARKLIKENSFISAVGHKATAQIMSELFGVEVVFNRIKFEQEVAQLAIAFKLNERQLEGTILSKDEVKEIGYSLKIMERVE